MMQHNCRYPSQAWELLLGYDQELSMGDRAATAVLARIKCVGIATSTA